jgi:transketolase
MDDIDKIMQAKAIELGRLAVRATTAAKSGHPTTALSLAHLTAVLMYRVMRWDPKRPEYGGCDRLVLSEGHAVPIVYAACADLGVTFYPHGHAKAMDVDDLMTLRDIDSVIDGHPNPALGFPFFDAATGSLGQGLSVAAGLACAARLDDVDKMIYCIIGDGEAREGQIWEAMDFIADMRLTNVVAIFNCNTLGQSDFVAKPEDWQHLQRKAEAFGSRTVVIDGHDPAAIEEALRQRSNGSDRPLCLIARTVKGWGVAQIQGMGHHGVAVPPDQLEAVLAELDNRAAELGAKDVSQREMTQALAIPEPPPAPRTRPAGKVASFAEVVHADPKLAEAVDAKKKLSPRRAYGMALKALGDADPGIVALDGDVKNSTYAEYFANAHPHHYFEGRIAEQNMVSTAAGLAAAGKIPFVSTFGRFMERAFDQVEMAVIGGANIKLVGTHVGVTLAADGPSQMALGDVAFMRAIAHAKDHRNNPAMTVLTPSDAVSAYNMVVEMAAYPSACYLRAVRADLPLLYKETESFPFGGHKVLRKASAGGRMVLLVADGYLVHSCLAAAAILEEAGFAATVVDAYALPMDTDAVLALAREAGGAILTVEDNYAGGIGSELSEAAAAAGGPPRARSLFVRNIPKSGRTPDDLLAYVHVSVAEIIRTAAELAGGGADGPSANTAAPANSS